MAKYSDLLKDPRWQKVRLKKLEAANWCCQSCFDSETMLAVHHKRYVKGRMPWEYDVQELVVLCQPCHEDEHDRKDIRTELMARLAVDGPMSLDDFMAYGSGAMPDWMADDVLKALFEQVRSIKPQQFAGGRFLRNLDVFGIGREGYELMADLLDDPSSQFFGDLLDVMRKHGVKLLGDAKGDGVA